MEQFATKPIVSVVMITFNHESFLESAILGVLQQQVEFELELIISDDCSPDNTRALVERFKSHHENGRFIRYFRHSENIGMQRNSRFALEQCRGKYIALCEGDDYWTDRTKLQKQVDFLEANGVYAGTYHDVQVLFHETGEHGSISGKNSKSVITTADTFVTKCPFHTNSFVFKRAALQLPSWLDQVVSMDMALYSIVSKHGPIRKVAGTMAVYRKNIGGITETEYVKRTFHSKRVYLMERLDEFHEFKFRRYAERVIKSHETAIRNANRPPSVFFKMKQRLKRMLGIQNSKWKTILRSGR